MQYKKGKKKYCSMDIAMDISLQYVNSLTIFFIYNIYELRNEYYKL